MSVTLRSFAKINLGLRIGAPRPDGFHELLTVYQTIALHDLIRVSVQRGSGIEIQCTDPRVPCDDSNTCYRIVEPALPALNAKGRVVIEIEKRLPVQGGLGGASANAVTTLLGLERALRKSLLLDEKLRIAAEVGSDLPLFLIGGAVLGVGRGEQVYPLPDFPATPCVVVTPQVGVSTAKAFADWDRFCESGRGEAGRRGAGGFARESAGKLTASPASDRMNGLGRGVSAWLSEAFFGRPYSSAPSDLKRGGRAGNPLLWLVRAGIENDFEQVVFPEDPELRAGKGALERAGAKYASLSGSGSTLYGLFASHQAAQQAALRLRKQGWTAQATVTLPRRQYWRRISDC
jgi:4-diphosphocytidyl-2-C-methyl-D-erythritol kinase